MTFQSIAVASINQFHRHHIFKHQRKYYNAGVVAPDEEGLFPARKQEHIPQESSLSWANRTV